MYFDTADIQVVRALFLLVTMVRGFFLVGMLYGGDKQDIGSWDPCLLKTAIECMISRDLDFKTLRSCARASKNMYQLITQELIKRKIELK